MPKSIRIELGPGVDPAEAFDQVVVPPGVQVELVDQKGYSIVLKPGVNTSVELGERLWSKRVTP